MIIISLGGSVIVPHNINIEFLEAFKKVITASKEKFIIVVGGGKTCRTYQDAAKDASPEDLDWIGIAATHLNAQLLRSVFGKATYEKIITDPTKKAATQKILIAAGWKPGWSTDTDAVHFAKTYGAKTIINMTNVDYLYEQNPNEHPNAKKLTKASWSQLKKIVGTVWKPGLNRPFDPVATKLAAQLKVKLIIIGPDIKNLENVLANKSFRGTVIS